MFCESVFRNITKFTGKHLCQSLFVNKDTGLRSATLLKKRLWHMFSSEFSEVSKNTFIYGTPLVAASVLKNLANFTGKHLCWSLFFINLLAWGTPTQVFSCEICRMPILKNVYERLLLNSKKSRKFCTTSWRQLSHKFISWNF